jgi:hypothetical protein
MVKRLSERLEIKVFTSDCMPGFSQYVTMRATHSVL